MALAGVQGVPHLRLRGRPDSSLLGSSLQGCGRHAQLLQGVAGGLVRVLQPLPQPPHRARADMQAARAPAALAPLAPETACRCAIDECQLVSECVMDVYVWVCVCVCVCVLLIAWAHAGPTSRSESLMPPSSPSPSCAATALSPSTSNAQGSDAAGCRVMQDSMAPLRACTFRSS